MEDGVVCHYEPDIGEPVVAVKCRSGGVRSSLNLKIAHRNVVNEVSSRAENDEIGEKLE